MKDDLLMNYPVEVVDIDEEEMSQEDLITAASGPSQIPPELRAYWLGPKGSARVGGWGNEGSYRACVRELTKEGVDRKYVHGECANLYHEATGRSPGRKKEHALTADGYAVSSADKECPPGQHRMADGTCMDDSEMPNYAEWQGVLTVEGVESGDGRTFALGSLDWAQLPLPLMYQPANTGGHSGSVLVGQINNIARRNNELHGWGILDLNAKMDNGFPIGEEVQRLMQEEYLNGVSVDVDKVKNADVEYVFAPDNMTAPQNTIYRRGRVRGATLVAFPAFTEAAIYLTGDTMTASAVGSEILTAAARGGWGGMPIADDGRTWDKGSAIKRILNWAGDDISGKYARAFLWKDSDGDPDLQGSYKFPIADVIDGKLTIIPNAVRNAAARLDRSDIPADDKGSIRSTIDGILNRMHESSGDIVTAASHTITFPDLPPATWFDEPTDVEIKGAFTITDEGRIYGLVAPGQTTHRARKTFVPTGNVDYSRFLKGETLVAGGGRVRTGPITMNCGHAPTQNYGTLEDRIKHYDNSCSIVADINIGERPDGSVWIAGAAKKVDAEQFSVMTSCVLSGDWQPHPDKPGTREFVAALLVPVPGFAMARKAASVSYEDGALVASTIPVEYVETDKEIPLIAAAHELKQALTVKELLAKKMELRTHV